MTNIQISIPDHLAQEAQRAGLLSTISIEKLLREALRNEKINLMVQARSQIAADSLPLMSPEEIQAEIDAYRAETRYAASS